MPGDLKRSTRPFVEVSPVALERPLDTHGELGNAPAEMGIRVPQNGNPHTGATLERGLDILLAFVDQPTMTVRTLSARLSLRKSTAYRFVSHLRDRGFLGDLGEGHFRLGPRVLQLAEAVHHQFGIVELSAEVMAELSRATGETSLLTTVVQEQALAVRQVAAPQPIRLTFQPGVTRPLHAGASAKVLFAFLDARERERLLMRGRFDRRTSRTVTDAARLRRQLLRIRAQGYAVSTGEYEEAIRAVAAPVLEPQGGVWGLSVVGPAARMTDERLPLLIRAVVEAARSLGNRLRGSTDKGTAGGAAVSIRRKGPR
jgi:DNA-binding IclR family transcriptional regulator